MTTPPLRRRPFRAAWSQLCLCAALVLSAHGLAQAANSVDLIFIPHRSTTASETPCTGEVVPTRGWAQNDDGTWSNAHGLKNGACQNIHVGDTLVFRFGLTADAAGLSSWSFDLHWDSNLANSLTLVGASQPSTAHFSFNSTSTTSAPWWKPSYETFPIDAQQQSSVTEIGFVHGFQGLRVDDGSSIASGSFRAGTVTFTVDADTPSDVALGFFHFGAAMGDWNSNLVTPTFGSFTLSPVDTIVTETHSGTITEDTTWPGGVVHIITGNVTVNPGAVLTIAPGAVVKFEPGTRLEIGGALSAVGSEASPVIFTSYRDDSAGGDTNLDGPSEGQPGDWNQIKFTSTVVDSLTKLEHVEVRYAGSDTAALYIQSDITVAHSHITDSGKSGIYTYNASPTIEDNTIVRSAEHGLELYHTGTPLIRGNRIEDNGGHGIYVRTVNTSSNVSPVIENNEILNNEQWGIYTGGYDYYVYTTSPPITGNTITGNQRPGRLVATAVPNPSHGNVLTPNDRNELFILGRGSSARSTDLELAVLSPGEVHELRTYVIERKTLTMGSGTTLTVDPGVVVKFTENQSLDIGGTLTAVGTATEPVVFTSYQDDEYGGDTNEDGSASLPAPGDWNQIKFTTTAAEGVSRIEHAVVRYGGSSTEAIYLDRTDVTVANSTLSHSAGHALRSYRASQNLSDNEVFANAEDGYHFTGGGPQAISGGRIYANLGAGIEYESDSTDLDGNTVSGTEIFANLEAGITTHLSHDIDARGNWWGAADGPGGDGTGSGDAVVATGSGSILVEDLFEGFLTEGTRFSFFDAGPNTDRGEIAPPGVEAGQDTSEWGTDTTSRMLWDFDAVELAYPSLDPDLPYTLLTTYYNPDNTGSGGTLQSLSADGSPDIELQSQQPISRTASEVYAAQVPAAAYTGGTLGLNFIRENGYRATVSLLVLVENPAGDTGAPATALTSPLAGAELTGGSVGVTGTVSDAEGGRIASVEVGIEIDGSVTWVPVSSLTLAHEETGVVLWSYHWTLPADGPVTLYVRGRDSAGNVESVSTGTAVVVNQSLPTPVTGLAAVDSPADGGGSVDVSWQLSADDGAGASDVVSYAVERANSDLGPFTSPVSVGAGISMATDSSAITATDYFYRVVAVDRAGNRGVSVVYGPVTPQANPSGTDGTAPEDVTQFTAIAGPGRVELQWTASADTGGDLHHQLLDISTDGGASWGAPITLSKSRTSYTASGLVNDTAYDFRLRMVDTANPANTSSGATVNATPSATASIPVSGTLAGDTLWSPGTFWVEADLTVPAGATLTIAPGAVVKFAPGKKLTVSGQGHLAAIGTAAAPIVFTSLKDDAYGGDTNGDGDASQAQPGDWKHITLSSNASAQIKHAVIRYAGSADAALYIQSDITVAHSHITDSGKSGIYTYNASPTIEDNTIVRSAEHGLELYHTGTPLIRGNRIEDNGGHGIYVRTVNTSSNVSPVIENNEILNNEQWGIYTGGYDYYVYTTSPPITGNTITGNQRPARLAATAVPNPSHGNVLTPNDRNELFILGRGSSARSTDLELAVLSPGEVHELRTYVIEHKKLTMGSGTTLTVDPGVVVKFNGSQSLEIGGALSAVGSEASPVIFTSYRDDSAGGDTNGDGPSEGQPGDWQYLKFNTTVVDSLTKLEHVEVRYAGSDTAALYIQSDITVAHSHITDSGKSGIYTYDASPTIEDNTIVRSADHGLELYDKGTPLIRGNRIEDNGGHGIYVRINNHYSNVSPVIENNEILNNEQWGIYTGGHTYYDYKPTSPPITGNTITGNQRPARLVATAVPNPSHGNVLTPNDRNELFIIGRDTSARSTDLELAVLSPGEVHELRTYVIEHKKLTMGSGTTLTVDPGVVVKFTENQSLDIGGTLTAVGTATEPVVFTSYQDDEHGGDTNEDGSASLPAPGDWNQIQFKTTAAEGVSRIEHAVVRYGGRYSSNSTQAIYLDRTDVTVANSTLSHSAGHALRSYLASQTLSDNEVFANAEDGYHFTGGGPQAISGGRIYANLGAGIEYESSGTDSDGNTVSGTEIFANVEAGITTHLSHDIDARGNWWGAADGPGGDGTGSGDAVVATGSGSILVEDLFEGFLTEGTRFNFFDAGPNTDRGEILAPNVSGSPSSEFGESVAETVLYDSDEKRLNAEYSGLNADGRYELLLLYQNDDDGSSTQSLRDSTGLMLHGPRLLPSDEPIFVTVPLNGESVAGGSALLELEAQAGLRAMVSALFLVARPEAEDADDPSVSVTAPVNGALLPGGLQVVAGIANDSGSGIRNVEVTIPLAGGTSSWEPVANLAVSGAWQYLWQPPGTGNYEIRARVTDLAGKVGYSPAAVGVQIDASAPPPVENLVAAPAGASFLRLVWQLSSDDGAGADDVNRYEIYRQLGSIGDFVLAGQVLAGTSGFDDSAVVTGQGYSYKVRSVDEAGNASDSAIVGPLQLTESEDTTPPEDVTGLTANANQLNGSQISANLSWTASANTAGDLIGQQLSVSADGGSTYGTNAPDFNNQAAIPLATNRAQSQVTGLEAGTNYRFKIEVYDAAANYSPGATVDLTPTGAVTETAPVTGTLSGETVWNPGTFTVTGALTVPAGASLTIEPGTVVKFASGARLEVAASAQLTAVGSAAAPIVFTSLVDDEYGGDTNGDGDASQAQPGDWHYIKLLSGASAHIEHAVLRYGGAGAQDGLVYATGADPELRDLVVEKSETSGVHLENSSAQVLDSTIRSNLASGLVLNAGAADALRVERNRIEGNGSHGIEALSFSGTAEIHDNEILDNAGWGIHFDSGDSPSPPIMRNTITGNAASVSLPAGAFPDETNTLTPNTEPYIEVRGGEIMGSTELRRWDPDTLGEINTYLFCSDDTTVALEGSLSVAPGVTAKFCSGIGVTVDGRFVAEGTPEERITFTARNDAAYGYDLRAEATDIPARGSWDGLAFNDSFYEADSQLRYVRVRYGGASDDAGVYLNQADILIDNSEISGSSHHGIRINKASPEIQANRIWGNTQDGIHVEGASADPQLLFNQLASNGGDGIELRSSAQATASNSQFYSNASSDDAGYAFGLHNPAGNPVDATESWWGESDGSGPEAATNPAGTGQRADANVDFSSFLTDAPFDYSYANFSEAGIESAGNLPAPVVEQGTFTNEWDQAEQRPDRTILEHPERVKIRYEGLAAGKRYVVRISYFNGDSGTTSYQSLASPIGGADETVHESIELPPSAPVQLEYAVPPSYYEDGSLSLDFVGDNTGQSYRVAVPEIWLVEDVSDLSPPQFEALRFNDVDGDQVLSEGDEYHFSFSEPMDTSLLTHGSEDADLRLAPNGASYGTPNQISWNADEKTAVVTLSAGFTVTGTETVTPDLSDAYGNATSGSQNLTLVDAVEPHFTGLQWLDQDDSGSLSVGDDYIFEFDEAMDASVIESGTPDANVNLRPEGGLRYGTVTPVAWSTDGRSVTVTINPGFSVSGDEVVTPGSFVTDVAGNSVTGTQFLLGKDITPPSIVEIVFHDADGNGAISLGDSYRFIFNEPIQTSALSDGSTDANTRLSPEGNKYGTVNQIEFNSGATEVTIEITSGFTITGDEVVTLSEEVSDRAGNTGAATEETLTLVDSTLPRIATVSPFYVSPVSATSNYRLTIRFDSAMDSSLEPSVTAMSDDAASIPTVPAGGTWLTTIYPNDTFTTADIEILPGMDGHFTAAVAGARDMAGNTMEDDPGAFSWEVNATAPSNPAVTLAATDCDSATLSWSGFSPPADLAGYPIYLKSGASFSDIGDATLLRVDPAGTTETVLESLAVGTPYHAAVVAMDVVGNITPSVTSVAIQIDSPIPGEVNAAVGPGAEADSAALDWSGYPTSSLCGLSGFQVFMEELTFSSVQGLTPLATLEPSERSFVVGGLDRSKVYYFAVVALNAEGARTDPVSPALWSDPYAGEITSDTTIGTGEDSEILISDAMVVKNGARLTVAPGTVLRFEAGTGITVVDGSLVATGTAFEPIILTSEHDTPEGNPAPGDWSGVLIASGGSESILSHVHIRYGQGLKLEDSQPTVEAFTALRNEHHGLSLKGAAVLNTSAALLRLNDVGASVESGGALTLQNSVIEDNALNASSDGSATLDASENWWGSVDSESVALGVTDFVDIEPILDYEPVLTPAIRAAGGDTLVTARSMGLELASRNAEEMRFVEDSTSEDPDFIEAGSFFSPFATTAPFTLSEGGGSKRIWAQFKSATGAPSAAIFVDLQYVDQGPVIDSFNLSEGEIVQRPRFVDASLSALLGLALVEVRIDDTVVFSGTETDLHYWWDPRDLSNGNHTFSLYTEDTAGNTRRQDVPVQVSLTPPPAPVITSPENGSILGADVAFVTGTAEPFITVRVMQGGAIIATADADANGDFSTGAVTLNEGTNTLTAYAEDQIGISPAGSSSVTLDQEAPTAPELSEATARSGGQGILLLWNPDPAGETPASFEIHRSVDPQGLTGPATSATLVQVGIESSYYGDVPAGDGTYFYSVVAADAAGNKSVFSNVLSAVHDATAPTFSVAYPGTPPFGPGTLVIQVSVDEPLVAAPSLTLTPAGATGPIGIALSEENPLSYTGSFDVESDTPSGGAAVAVSGRDLAGNFTAGVPGGSALAFDTDGPVASLYTTHGGPIQISAPVDVGVVLTLDEPARANTPVSLQFTPPQGGSVIVEMTGSGDTWTGTLPLAPVMGTGVGSFAFSAQDGVGNLGTLIAAGGSLEVYSGETPDPSDAPIGLSAVSRPAGNVELQWSSVEQAETYQVWRASGSCATTPDSLVATDVIGTQLTDLPPTDGTYCYAIGAERYGALSPLSPFVEAISDRLPPDTPENVEVSLQDVGVEITWAEPNAGETPDHYLVLRDGVSIATQPGDETAEFSALDNPTQGGSYSYQVVSVDSIGNPNPSPSVPLDLSVGAVSDLEILVAEGAAPYLTWQSNDEDVVGFNIYRGGLLLAELDLASLDPTAPAYEDTLFAGESRALYGVTAIDAEGQESPQRRATVYPVTTSGITNPDADGGEQALVVGYFNSIALYVTNSDPSSAVPISLLETRLTRDGEEIFSHSTEVSVSVTPEATHSENVVVPIPADPAEQILEVTAVQLSETGSSVLYRSLRVLGQADPPPISIELLQSDVPLAGGVTTITQCIFNAGTHAMDVVFSRNDGAEAGDIYVSLRNAEGLELSRTATTGMPPTGARFGPGYTFIRIEPGDEYCLDLDILVPASLEVGATLEFVAGVTQFSHDITGLGLASAAPLLGAIESGITLSSYTGTAAAEFDTYAYAPPSVDNECDLPEEEAAPVSQEISVQISGQALDRSSGDPLPDTDLKVGLLLRGFQWFEDVVTDASGAYSHTVQVNSALAGEFTIWAAHPDVVDALDQDRFTVHRAYALPNRAEIRSSKGAELPITLEIYNPGEETLSGFTPSFTAYTCSGPVKIEEPSIRLEPASADPFEVAPGEKASLQVVFSADADAPDFATLNWSLTSASGAAAHLDASVSLLPAVPTLAVTSPATGYVEASVNRGEVQTVPVTIQNKGLAELQGASLTLPLDTNWVTTSLPTDDPGAATSLRDIPVGEEVTFDVIVAPPSDEPFAQREFSLRIEGGNATPLTIPIVVSVTSAETGGVLFLVADPTVDDMNAQAVEGARVRMRNIDIGIEESLVLTDSLGVAAFEDLLEGRWSYQVIASGRRTVTGTVNVLPGRTVTVEASPQRDLVTIRFSVEPVPFTDRYEILVEQTFETRVPVPLLIVDPPVVNLDWLEPGSETDFFLTIRNAGIVNIYDIDVSSYLGDAAALTPMISYIPVLEPDQVVEVQVRAQIPETGSAPQVPGDTTSGNIRELGLCIAGFDKAAIIDRLKVQQRVCGRDKPGGRVADGGDLCRWVWIWMGTKEACTSGGCYVENIFPCIVGQLAGKGGLSSYARTEPWPTPGPFTPPRGRGCFAAGTPVAMADGSRRAIDSLAEGDLVLDIEGRPARVTQTYILESDHIRDLRYRVLSSGGDLSSNLAAGQLRRLETTDEHLFWVMDKEWTPAGQLEVGDLLLLSGGEIGQVVESARRDAPQTVYNIDVEENHAYFANEALAYQKCGGAAQAATDSVTERLRAARDPSEKTVQERVLSSARESR